MKKGRKNVDTKGFYDSDYDVKKGRFNVKLRKCKFGKGVEMEVLWVHLFLFLSIWMLIDPLYIGSEIPI
ncbi:hypothetical protein [Bacillus subtilis]|uniref:hypothetical protein n=1 Tax=Bacillus subtilis TaxID=1423 RepID=UPI00165A546F|nr:hypothetical protein [Bacillus subtilis]MEC1404393.1 hypothetical protein [Bacillus subtilis]MEC1423008.1 hypothetical protein [Bacillus subtilis]